MCKLDDIIKNGELHLLPSMILNLFIDLKERYEYNYKMVGECDYKTQDILHEIEMLNYDVFRGFKIYKELQATRQTRRQCKDENELLDPIYNYISSLQNCEGKLRKVSEKTIDANNCRERKSYHPRIKTEMENAFKKLNQTG